MSAVVVQSFGSVEEYAAWVDEIEAERAASEARFLAALESGKVLVEYWGSEEKCTIWHGTELGKGLAGVAAHVSNRFRAGWTRVEVADPAELVMTAAELPSMQQVQWRSKDGWSKRSVGSVERISEDTVRLTLWSYYGEPTVTVEVDGALPVRLV